MSKGDATRLNDVRDVEQIMYRFGRAIDHPDKEQTRKLLSNIMLPDLKMEYPAGEWSGRDNCIDVIVEGLLQFSFTHHLLTNPIVEIDGDRAEASYLTTGVHGGADGRVFLAGSRYTQELSRTAEGWRIARHHCGEIWLEENATGVVLSATASAET